MAGKNIYSKITKTIVVSTLILSSLLGSYYLTKKDKENQIYVKKEYGKIIYQKNPKSKKHLYIIGQRHPDPLNPAFVDELTSKVQAEIYRISEDLIKKEKIDLLFLEGAFHHIDYTELYSYNFVRGNIDEKTLEKIKLLDDFNLERLMAGKEKEKMNAPRLLKLNYDIKIKGADNNLAQEMQLECIRLEKQSKIKEEIKKLEEIITYFNEIRSASNLINSKSILDKEVSEGKIKEQKAIIIIGADHLKEIIEYVKKDKIEIPKAEITINELEIKSNGLKQALDLDEKEYGITIIVPNSIH